MSTYKLQRRGYYLGEVTDQGVESTANPKSAWQSGKPIFLKSHCVHELETHARAIKQSQMLYQAILDEEECDQLLAETPYAERLAGQFESLGSSYNEGDDQEIETILFDAVENNEVIAEDLWLKVSWLSFYEEDASLRFRFSFGVDNLEDVADDPQRQHYASLLTDAVFPESQLITQNQSLNTLFCEILDCKAINFVERIIYFNSLDGGAYLHHDRERGHAGVVYAQVTGHTYWLALPKLELMSEISHFVNQCQQQGRWPDSLLEAQQQELIELSANRDLLSSELETFSNDTLIQLINESKLFVQQLILRGHGIVVESGDILLLPQETDLECCWHSVFNLGEEAGEALSFAVRSG